MVQNESQWETRMRLSRERLDAQSKMQLAMNEYERACARETDFLEKMWEKARLQRVDEKKERGS